MAIVFGYDASGRGNNWTANNLSSTAGAGNDSLTDTPTAYGTDTGVGGTVRGNYCTWNGVSIGADATLTNGNLDIAYGSSGTRNATMGTFGMSSGKWYWEVTITASSLSPTQAIIGITNNPSAPSVSNFPGFSTNGWGYYGGDGNKYTNGSASAYGASFTTNDVIGFAFDADAGSITAYKNGVSQGVMFSSLVANTYYPAIGDGASAATFSASANFGQRAFAYTAPSGFKALCTQNLPTPTIGATSTTQADNYFGVSLYTGTGSQQSITGLEFQPDFFWSKGRSAANAHILINAVNGPTKFLSSNNSDAEVTTTNGTLVSFNSNGVTLQADTNGYANFSGRTYVAWQWRAAGSTVTNTAGTITSTVSANTTSGFSIVTYTGTGSAATIGHGLGVAPSMIIVKNRQAANSWGVYHVSTGANQQLLLNSTNGISSDTQGFTAVPSSTVFSVGTGASMDTNQTSGGGQHVAYCFAPVAGYSAFGSYTGNGSADGPFVYLGFRPRYLLTKETSASGQEWFIWDAARNPYNQVDNELFANSAAAENSTAWTYQPYIDFLSNGFKLRSQNTHINGSGSTLIYAAFAENPFKYSLAR